jgi:general secretion pathway protein A
MYLNYFNLKREPFNITPDPELLYLSPSHKEALAAVIYGVSRRKGFVAITGEVGVGKTTIIRSFLDKTDKQNVRTIYIFNANVSFKALLKTIYQNLKRVPQTDDVSEMVDQLHMILIDEYKKGHNVVLIIDEAQNMPVETLENLRMLSNLETSTDKLMQIVFSGQPEFEEKLKVYALRQLRQRIAIRMKIQPLTRTESLAYINYRLHKSLTKEAVVFTRGALNRIVEAAEGIPRIINIYCDNCLITSFGNQQKKVTSRVAREIIAEQGVARGAMPRWQIACLAALVMIVFAFTMYLTNRTAVPSSAQVSTNNMHVDAASEKTSVKSVHTLPARPESVPDEAAKDLVAVKQERLRVEEATGNGNNLVSRVARRGDTLAKLVMETYGSVDWNLLKQVKQRNPGITNVDVIREGERIYFPVKGN